MCADSYGAIQFMCCNSNALYPLTYTLIHSSYILECDSVRGNDVYNTIKVSVAPLVTEIDATEIPSIPFSLQFLSLGAYKN